MYAIYKAAAIVGVVCYSKHNLCNSCQLFVVDPQYSNPWKYSTNAFYFKISSQYTDMVNNLNLTIRFIWSSSIRLVFFNSNITVALFMTETGVLFWGHVTSKPKCVVQYWSITSFIFIPEEPHSSFLCFLGLIKRLRMCKTYLKIYLRSHQLQDITWWDSNCFYFFSVFLYIGCFSRLVAVLFRLLWCSFCRRPQHNHFVLPFSERFSTLHLCSNQQ